MGSTCLLYLLIVVFVYPARVPLYKKKRESKAIPYHVGCSQAVLYFNMLQFTRKQEANDNFCLGIVDDIKLILSGRRNTLFLIIRLTCWFSMSSLQQRYKSPKSFPAEESLCSPHKSEASYNHHGQTLKHHLLWTRQRRHSMSKGASFPNGRSQPFTLGKRKALNLCFHSLCSKSLTLHSLL